MIYKQKLVIKNNVESFKRLYFQVQYCLGLAQRQGFVLSEALIVGWHEVTGSRLPERVPTMKLLTDKVCKIPLCKKKKTEVFLLWRRDRDLNPGYISVHSRSKTARSTTLTSLHIKLTKIFYQE